MALILPFIRSRSESFDPDATRIMGEAFDAARKALGTSGTDDVCENVACRIIDTARGGERDPHRLMEAGLETWGRK